MIISTKGRYAMRVVVDLAHASPDEYVPIKTISEREGISLKYLESIVSMLVKGGVLASRRGADGGYRLSRSCDKISVGDIVRLTEGKLAAVSCLEGDENTCQTADCCLTLPMWNKLDSMINSYLDSVTISDLLNRSV